MKPARGRNTEAGALVVTFDSTACAFALQACAGAYGLEGRLAPIPRSLSADCGVAWREPPANGPALRRALHREGIEHRAILRA